MNAMASPITSLTIVYSTIYPGADQRKHQSPASLAFVRGIHWWPVKSPHKGPVRQEMFPFYDVIMAPSSSACCLLGLSYFLYGLGKSGNNIDEIVSKLFWYNFFFFFNNTAISSFGNLALEVWCPGIIFLLLIKMFRILSLCVRIRSQ